MPVRRSILAVFAFVAACDRPASGVVGGGRDRTAPDALRPVPARTAFRVVLVDSTRYANEIGTYDGALYRVAVVSATGADTIPGVVTDVLPVTAGDTMVYGLRSREGLHVGLFGYDVRSRHVLEIAAPVGWVASSEPALSPDGQYVAYVAADSATGSYGAVARVPSGAVVYHGPVVASRETDARVDDVRWTGLGRFEIRIDLPLEVRGTHRISGRVAPPCATVDTVPEPAGPSGRAPDG